MTETQTVDLAAWLTRIWDEEERRLTRATNRGAWVADGLSVKHQPTGDTLARFVYPGDADHAEHWQPGAVLARIAADRKILELHKPYQRIIGLGCETCLGSAVKNKPASFPGWPCPTLRLLASPYKGREGWQEAWDE